MSCKSSKCEVEFLDPDSYPESDRRTRRHRTARHIAHRSPTSGRVAMRIGGWEEKGSWMEREVERLGREGSGKVVERG